MLNLPCNKDYSAPRKRRRVGRIRKERISGFLNRIVWDGKGRDRMGKIRKGQGKSNDGKRKDTIEMDGKG